MKRHLEGNNGSSKRLNDDAEEPGSNFFAGLQCYILPNKFGTLRSSIFKTQIRKYGGKVHEEALRNVTHIIVEESLDKDSLLLAIKGKEFKDTKCIKCSWVSRCIKNKKLMPAKLDEVVYDFGESSPETLLLSHSYVKGILSKTSETAAVSPLLSAVQTSSHHSHQESPDSKFLNKFACAHSSHSKPDSVNQHIVDELSRLSTAYESKRDTWHAFGYQKAIAAIRNYPKEITSWEEARRIRGIGDRLADKIVEIIESGKLRKAEVMCEDEETKVLQLFTGVWGAGPSTAQNWYTQGFRCLEDLKEKAKLTRHQEIGVKYYEEFSERMSRSEVQEIESQVYRAAANITGGVEVVVCGSYRRGKATCGDVDVLISHPDGHSHEHIFKSLLDALHQCEFITDDLVTQEHNGNQQKYLGVCKLPGEDKKHRRLDIIVVPYAEFAPALLYFTGSAHFNRSMRLLATKLGMSLSEHGLRAGIVRDGREKVTGGYLLPTPTEESIFNHLGLQYRPPEERDH